MKGKLTLALLMMSLASPAGAQVPTRARISGERVDAVRGEHIRAAGITRAPPLGVANAPRPATNGPPQQLQQGNPNTVAPTLSPVHPESDSQGHKVCRVVGETVYYCM